MLTSLYVDPEGELQLGIFVRPRDKEPYVRQYDHMFDEASMGEAATRFARKRSE